MENRDQYFEGEAIPGIEQISKINARAMHIVEGPSTGIELLDRLINNESAIPTKPNNGRTGNGDKFGCVPRRHPRLPTDPGFFRAPIPRPRPRRTIAHGDSRDIRLEDVPPPRLWNDPFGLTNARIEALISARRAAA